MKRELTPTSLSNVCISAAFFGVLYFLWLAAGMIPNGPDYWLVYGLLAGFVAGAISRLWIRGAMTLCISAGIGLYGIGILITWSSFESAFSVAKSIYTLGREELVFFTPLIVAWLIADYGFKRVKAMKVK
jgi:hypothetical protein